MPEIIKDRLEDMFDLQRELQARTYGKDPNEMFGLEAIQFFKDMNLALQDELHEALGEIGWKPWASSKHFNYSAVHGELIDAFHFFMNLCLVADLTPAELYEGYVKKRGKNIKRQEAGYDGVSEKCPVCQRALDDDAVKCGPHHLGAAYFVCWGTGSPITHPVNVVREP